jgi:hypothetical protein
MTTNVIPTIICCVLTVGIIASVVWLGKWLSK